MHVSLYSSCRPFYCVVLCAYAFLIACTASPPVAQHAASPPTGMLSSPLPYPAQAVSDDQLDDISLEFMPEVHLSINRAVHQATQRVAGWSLPLPEVPSYHELLNASPDPEESFSSGTIQNGELINSVALPASGPCHSIIDRHRARHTNFATQELVNLILHGAASVSERYPNTVLRIGNMSFKHGGRIPWSNSHQSGRDADLAFYAVHREDGEHIPTPDLIAFDDSGNAIGHKHLIFDVARNWELVKALLTYEEVTVQWLFISEGLKQLLLNYAITRHEPEQLINRARLVLHQPTDAPPHNDHFHLRVACSKSDRLRGCIDGYPRWEWADWHEAELLALALEMSRALKSESREIRLKALSYLDRVRPPATPEVVLSIGVWDTDDEVRARALEVASLPLPWSATAIVSAIRHIRSQQASFDDRQMLYQRLSHSQDPLIMDFILERLNDHEVDSQEKVIAAATLLHQMKPELVPHIIKQFENQPGAVRHQLASVLRRITGHSFFVNWTAEDQESVQNAVQRWKGWWAENRDRSRAQWLEDMFRVHDLNGERLNMLSTVDTLLPLLLHDDDFVAYNTHLQLRELTRRWIPWNQENPRRVHARWSRWWNFNRDRLLNNDLPASWQAN